MMPSDKKLYCPKCNVFKDTKVTVVDDFIWPDEYCYSMQLAV